MATEEGYESAVTAPEKAKVVLDPAITPELRESLKAVIFDFDLTILQIHSFGEGIVPEAIAVRHWEADFASYDEFTKLCRELVDNGIHVGVASFGRKAVIKTYLELAFQEDMAKIFPDKAICTPADLGGEDGTPLPDGKNSQLAWLETKLGLKPEERSKVLFFDGEPCSFARGRAPGGPLQCSDTPAAGRLQMVVPG